jgi:hypothetical protein
MAMPAKAVFWLTDGSVINVTPDEYRAVLDRRGDWEEPQRVWEILVGGIVVKRLWPEQILKWDLVE